MDTPGRARRALGGLLWPVASGTHIRHRPSPRRAGIVAILVLLGLTIAAASALALSWAGDDGASARAISPAARTAAAAAARTAARRPTTVSVAVNRARPGSPVQQRFLGLSFEVSDLALIAGYGTRGDLPELLRSLGPGLLRFGGISADTRTAWTDEVVRRPAWASNTIGPEDFRHLRVLAQESGWSVLLTVGLAHYDPGAAAREVASAKAILGPWLAGIEIGNESDAYARHGFRRQPWGPGRYLAQVTAYRRAIDRLAPGIPLAGPDVSGSRSFQSWGPAEVRSQQPAMLTGHHYPLGCHLVHTASIQRLLSPLIRAREGTSLTRYMQVASRAHIPLRVDEANTVSCGGVAGISDTFAAALWATSYIAHTMTVGVAGINLEGNPARCTGYSVVCASSPARLAAGQLQVQPEWYALLLARALVGDRPLRTSIRGPAGTNITSTALLAPDGTMRLVLVDEEPPGSPAASVHVRVGAGYRTANAIALTAPSPQALSGASLGGSSVAADGSWPGPSRTSPLPVSGGLVDRAA